MEGGGGGRERESVCVCVCSRWLRVALCERCPNPSADVVYAEAFPRKQISFVGRCRLGMITLDRSPGFSVCSVKRDQREKTFVTLSVFAVSTTRLTSVNLLPPPSTSLPSFPLLLLASEWVPSFGCVGLLYVPRVESD